MEKDKDKLKIRKLVPSRVLLIKHIDKEKE